MKNIFRVAGTHHCESILHSARNVMCTIPSTESFHALVRVCPHIHNLHIRTGSFITLAPGFATLPLTRLHCHPIFFRRAVENQGCAFALLTHLELFRPLNREAWLILAQLPKLTHLAMRCNRDLGSYSQLLATCISLRALVLLSHPTETEPGVLDLLLDDPRLVILFKMDDYAADWQHGALTGHDYWERVDVFIKKRRSGEIHRGTLFL
ncbi:hypothetical protein MVEN_01886400 [Mycena venus]|uniref:F-box domain-containing protein n=1 Tax=Mycena venus TaxID=2733690 RepID=A0A8H6XHA1_9AGAR|nr:hypothetical protein MVEN_01886400 [Mycena venus]